MSFGVITILVILQSVLSFQVYLHLERPQTRLLLRFMLLLSWLLKHMRKKVGLYPSQVTHPNAPATPRKEGRWKG